MDRYAFYRFCFDDANNIQAQTLMTLFQQNVALDVGSIINYLFENLSYLLQLAPEATLRQILRKRYFGLIKLNKIFNMKIINKSK